MFPNGSNVLFKINIRPPSRLSYPIKKELSKLNFAVTTFGLCVKHAWHTKKFTRRNENLFLRIYLYTLPQCKYIYTVILLSCTRISENRLYVINLLALIKSWLLSFWLQIKTMYFFNSSIFSSWSNYPLTTVKKQQHTHC